MNKLLFLCFASAILLFSIIAINIAPIINNLVGSNWMNNSCKYYSDQYKINKDKTYANEEAKKETLDPIKKNKEICNRKQAMRGLEYSIFNINIVIGGICALLGLLHFLNLGSLGRITGLIGLGGGAICFVLTLVYVIESGLVFTDIDGSNIRMKSDGSYLTFDKSKNHYVCKFYKEKDKYSVYRKYSDYGNKYLSYSKDVYFAEDEKNFKYCQSSGYAGCVNNNPNYSKIGSFWKFCKLLQEKNEKDADISTDERDVIQRYTNILEYKDDKNNPIGNCDDLYIAIKTQSNSNKILYDRWLTTLILSCFVFLFCIGLAIFGFLLYQDSNGLSGTVSIK